MAERYVDVVRFLGQPGLTPVGEIRSDCRHIERHESSPQRDFSKGVRGHHLCNWRDEVERVRNVGRFAAADHDAGPRLVNSAPDSRGDEVYGGRVVFGALVVSGCDAADAIIMSVKDQWCEQALALNEMGRRFYTPLSQMAVRSCENFAFGRVDGHVVGLLFNHFSGTDGDKTFRVGIISVNHLKGVGKAMMNCAYQEAMKSGANVMRIEAFTHGHPAANMESTTQ